MAKIGTRHAAVELDGPEMTRMIRHRTRENLILRYVDLTAMTGTR